MATGCGLRGPISTKAFDYCFSSEVKHNYNNNNNNNYNYYYSHYYYYYCVCLCMFQTSQVCKGW